MFRIWWGHHALGKGGAENGPTILPKPMSSEKRALYRSRSAGESAMLRRITHLKRSPAKRDRRPFREAAWTARAAVSGKGKHSASVRKVALHHEGSLDGGAPSRGQRGLGGHASAVSAEASGLTARGETRAGQNGSKPTCTGAEGTAESWNSVSFRFRRRARQGLPQLHNRATEGQPPIANEKRNKDLPSSKERNSGGYESGD
jgi:hypothetical protein